MRALLNSLGLTLWSSRIVATFLTTVALLACSGSNNPPAAEQTLNTNYDIVAPSDFYFARLMKAGAFRKLDKAALPNSANLDPDLMQKLAVHDPGNQYSVP